MTMTVLLCIIECAIVVSMSFCRGVCACEKEEQYRPIPICIGIDGGSTNTKLAVARADTGELLLELMGGASNPNSVGKTAARQTLLDIVDQALRKVEYSQVEVVQVAAGISGISNSADSHMISSWIQQRLPHAKVQAYNDVVAAIVSGTDGHLSGFALIAGTGSNCMGVEGSRQESAGHWGPYLGTGGSGHALASQALSACCRAVDGRGPPTLLQPLIERALGWAPGAFPDRIIEWMYSEGVREWGEIAALAPVVFAAQLDNDAVANTIINEQVKEMATMVQTVARKMEWNDAIVRPLVLVGSLWKQAILVERFVAELDRLGVAHRLVLPKLSPAQGAARLAWRQYRHSNSIADGIKR